MNQTNPGNPSESMSLWQEGALSAIYEVSKHRRLTLADLACLAVFDGSGSNLKIGEKVTEACARIGKEVCETSPSSSAYRARDLGLLQRSDDGDWQITADGQRHALMLNGWLAADPDPEAPEANAEGGSAPDQPEDEEDGPAVLTVKKSPRNPWTDPQAEERLMHLHKHALAPDGLRPEHLVCLAVADGARTTLAVTDRVSAAAHWLRPASGTVPSPAECVEATRNALQRAVHKDLLQCSKLNCTWSLTHAGGRIAKALLDGGIAEMPETPSGARDAPEGPRPGETYEECIQRLQQAIPEGGVPPTTEASAPDAPTLADVLRHHITQLVGAEQARQMLSPAGMLQAVTLYACNGDQKKAAALFGSAVNAHKVIADMGLVKGAA